MDYSLRYLPIAKQDLADAINYILKDLQNPIAAKTIHPAKYNTLFFPSRVQYQERQKVNRD